MLEEYDGAVKMSCKHCRAWGSLGEGAIRVWKELVLKLP